MFSYAVFPEQVAQRQADENELGHEEANADEKFQREFIHAGHHNKVHVRLSRCCDWVEKTVY